MGSVVIFDMGGVLYDFQGARLIARTSRRPRRWRSEEVQADWPPLVHGFETGVSSEAVFAEAVVQRYDLSLTPFEFLAEFRSAAVGYFDGALSLVGEGGVAGDFESEGCHGEGVFTAVLPCVRTKKDPKSLGNGQVIDFGRVFTATEKRQVFFSSAKAA